MARTTDQPRLSKLDPAAVAGQLVEVLVRHAAEIGSFVARQSFAGDTGWLRSHLELLVEYAQGGRVRTPVAFIEHLTARLANVLLCSPWEARGVGLLHPRVMVDRLSLSDELGLLFHACLARIALVHDERLRITDLAVLAEVTPDHIRLLMRQGLLPPQPSEAGSLVPFSAPVARAFLRGRSVKGVRDELKLEDRVELLGFDRTFGPRLYDLAHEAPTEHVGERGFVVAVQVDATAECSVRLDSGTVISVKPRWLSKIEPLGPAPADFGRYGERAETVRAGTA